MLPELTEAFERLRAAIAAAEYFPDRSFALGDRMRWSCTVPDVVSIALLAGGKLACPVDPSMLAAQVVLDQYRISVDLYDAHVARVIADVDEAARTVREFNKLPKNT